MNFKNIISLFLLLLFIISCKSLKILEKKEMINELSNNNLFEMNQKIDSTFYNNYKKGNDDYYKLDVLNKLYNNKEFKKIDTISINSNFLKKNKSFISLVSNGEIIIFSNNYKIIFYDIDKLSISNTITLELNLLDDFATLVSAAKINNLLFVSYSNGVIICIDFSGKILWRENFKDLVKTPIKIYNNNLILILSDKIFFLDSNNGSIIWEFTFEGKNLLQSKGGDIAIFNNLIYAILPNGQIGEINSLFGEKNDSIFSKLQLYDSIDNSDDKIHVYDNYISYFDKNKYITTIDIKHNNFIVNKKLIKNSYSYKFYNNSLFVLDEDKFLNAYNIFNNNLFWKTNISKYIKNNIKLINISNSINSLFFFFNNGNILEINLKNGQIIENRKLNVKKIYKIKFYKDKIITFDNNGKVNIISQ